MKKIFILVLTFCLIFCGESFAVKKEKQITATSWLVADGNGKIIKSVNHDEIHSIASITKLMTAMVVLDAKQNLDEKIGKFTRRQHLQLALIKSNNRSAEILCENYPGGMPRCVEAMNRKLKSLKMENSIVYEPTGLDKRNVSTAREITYLTKAASEYSNIVYASRRTEIKIQSKKKWFSFRNTNPMVGHYQNIVVSKTGFINESGGCITLLLDTSEGERLIVVLGSKNTHTRIPEAEFIYEIYKD